MSQIYFIWSNTLQDSDGPSFHHQEFKTVHTATGMSDTTDCLLALRSTALWASNNNNSSNKVILTRQIISTYNISWRHRGGREVEIYFSFNLGAMWGCVVNATLRPDPTRPDPTRPDRCKPGNEPSSILQEPGWVPGAGFTVAENLATKRNRSLDLPVCSSNNNNNNVGLLYLRTIKMVEKCVINTSTCK